MNKIIEQKIKNLRKFLLKEKLNLSCHDLELSIFPVESKNKKKNTIYIKESLDYFYSYEKSIRFGRGRNVEEWELEGDKKLKMKKTVKDFKG